jgi:hypothetical protein
LLVPDTAAVNCCVEPVATLTLAGVTLTETPEVPEVRVTVADPDFEESATLFAVTVTVLPVRAVVGAAYRPEAVMVP